MSNSQTQAAKQYIIDHNPEDHDEKIKQMNKDQYLKYRDSYIKASQRYLGNNPKKRLYISLKNSAKQKGEEVMLQEQDIVLNERCPILGIKINYDLGMGLTPYNPYITRKDKTKPYTADNIWVISYKAGKQLPRQKRQATMSHK